MKRCTKCEKWKSAPAFSKDKQAKDGLCYWCKKCKKEYHQEHKTEAIKRSQKYYQEHKVEAAKYNREHKAEKTERDRIYHQEHKTEIIERNRKRRTVKDINRDIEFRAEMDRRGLSPIVE